MIMVEVCSDLLKLMISLLHVVEGRERFEMGVDKDILQKPSLSSDNRPAILSIAENMCNGH